MPPAPSTTDTDELLRALFGGPSPRAGLGDPASTVERAILGGYAARDVGEAFRAGYLAAIARLGGSARPGCLAASEEGGAHPKNIRTRLTPSGEGYVLDGAKTWVTLATEVEELLVVATVGEHEGKNLLRVARVPTGREGVTLTPRPPTPFAPEIVHATATFAGVRVAGDELLPGDGYAEYVKPFRTIEDIHVGAAVLAFLVATARRHALSSAVLVDLLPLLLAARTLASCDPKAPETHVALAGVFAGLSRLLGADTTTAAIEAMPEDERGRLRRDLPLLLVAERARALRLTAALEAIARRTSPTP